MTDDGEDIGIRTVTKLEALAEAGAKPLKPAKAAKAAAVPKAPKAPDMSADPSAAQKAEPAAPTPTPKPKGKPLDDDAILAMTGAAFASLADLIGDAHTLCWREQARAAITGPDDVTDLVIGVADDIRAQCPPGRSPEVVTFDFSLPGDVLFVGARVRFV